MEKDWALQKLTEWLPKGSKVFTNITWRNRAGDSWAVQLLIALNGEVMDISAFAAPVMGVKFNRNHGGVTVGGGNMNMAFHAVYTLAHYLHDDGYALEHRGL